ncbi:MAG TPA: DUF427 domain-containing protein [Pseudonocardiaceae bacterium]|nr:DUF427 domain-containing protein [Pseudonocardiaceae bacterium]
MALTLGDGPLSSRPRNTVNYRIDGPAHRLLFEPFPRRVRAVFGGATVLDTTNGMLLYESNLLPQLYLPRDDVRDDLLTRTDQRTHCPFKGDASYWSVTVEDRTADNALWCYLDPRPDAGWLRDHVALYWGSMDAWFDEDEEVAGHLRDPYHRVDVRSSSRHVRVVADGEVIAESRRTVLLSETGRPNRFYLPADDVRHDLLELSGTHTVCPYKGTASYRSLRTPSGIITDAAWYYPEPLDGVQAIRGHLCFAAKGIQTWVDGVFR